MAEDKDLLDGRRNYGFPKIAGPGFADPPETAASVSHSSPQDSALKGSRYEDPGAGRPLAADAPHLRLGPAPGVAGDGRADSPSPITQPDAGRPGQPNLRGMLNMTVDAGQDPAAGRIALEAELLAKLRLTEEQLAKEHRHRKALEIEFAAGKALVQKLSDRLDRLSGASGSDSWLQQVGKRLESVEELQHQWISADQTFKSRQEGVVARLERDNARMITMMSEFAARQHTMETSEEESAGRQRRAAEEVASVRSRLETLESRTSEGLHELAARADKDQQDERRQLSDALRVIARHERALEGIQNALELQLSTISRRITDEVEKVKRRVESEAQARESLEGNAERMAEEFRKIAGMQEREIVRQVGDVRALAAAVTVKEGSERTREWATVREEMRGMQIQLAEDIAFLKALLKEMNVKYDQEVAKERAARKDAAERLRSELEVEVRAWRQQSANKWDEQNRAMGMLKEACFSAIRTTQQMVAAAENDGELRIKSLENVLRAEIKQRSEEDTGNLAELEDVRLATKLQAEHISQKMEEQERNFLQTTEQLQMAMQSREASVLREMSADISDIGLRVGKLTKRLSDSESVLADRLKHMGYAVDGVRRECASIISDRARAEEEIEQLKVSTSGLLHQAQNAESAMAEFRVDTERRMTARAVQLDQTLTAMKEEFNRRALKDELSVMQQDAEARFRGLATTVDQIGREISDVDRRVKEGLGAASAKQAERDAYSMQIAQRLNEVAQQAEVSEAKADGASLAASQAAERQQEAERRMSAELRAAVAEAAARLDRRVAEVSADLAALDARSREHRGRCEAERRSAEVELRRHVELRLGESARGFEKRLAACARAAEEARGAADAAAALGEVRGDASEMSRSGAAAPRGLERTTAEPRNAAPPPPPPIAAAPGDAAAEFHEGALPPKLGERPAQPPTPDHTPDQSELDDDDRPIQAADLGEVAARPLPPNPESPPPESRNIAGERREDVSEVTPRGDIGKSGPSVPSSYGQPQVGESTGAPTTTRALAPGEGIYKPPHLAFPGQPRF
ncbi:MAG: hypothetical protein BJ554DRAFT_5778 [Olpidium bornovanus]|uniref:Uncharacterized protein n=1 Tax=Olpidium bornovanus TaxID=278681 RepID=A0A8H7ZYT2_9FUNG|nr:MAG: hypothetical protein BJ554DRAFT_5778 [Olpidium bornovanus]